MIGPSADSAHRVFIDTSAYFAAVNRRDASHRAASGTPDHLISQRRRLVTTNFILAELHALMLARIGRETAALVLFEIDASAATMIVRVSAADERRARAIIGHYRDKDFSLTDATSFAVMERHGVKWVFSLDRDFAQYGWNIIDPNEE